MSKTSLKQTTASTKGQLNAGWKMVKFGDVVNDVKESEKNPQNEGLDRYVGLEHIEPKNLRLKKWGDLTTDDVSFTKRFRKGQVLFAKRRAYQRKVVVAEFDGICSSDILTFEPKDDALIPDLLPFIVQSDPFFDHALDTSSGSLSPRTRWSQLKDFEFTLPPKDEQRRIAEILLTMDASIEAFFDASIGCNTLRRVLLFQLMSGRITHETTKSSKIGLIPTSWDIDRIDSVGDVKLGRQRAPKYQSGSFTKPYLRVANVFDGYLDLRDVNEMDFNASDFATFELKRGDILLNEGQSRELVGRCAMYNGEIENCCFQNTLVRFRSGDRLIQEFAFYYFQYLYYKGVFASISSQTTSIAHLGAERFSKLFVGIPPLEEQKKIVRIIRSTTDQLVEIKSHLHKLTEIKKSLTEEMLQGKHVTSENI